MYNVIDRGGVEGLWGDSGFLVIFLEGYRQENRPKGSKFSFLSKIMGCWFNRGLDLLFRKIALRI
jgi:hypothetical protein